MHASPLCLGGSRGMTNTCVGVQKIITISVYEKIFFFLLSYAVVWCTSRSFVTVHSRQK